MKIFVETEQFILREIVLEDLEGMYALDSDPEVHKYLGNHPVKSREQSRKIIEHVRNQYVVNGIGRWAIIDKSSEDFIGWTGLKYEEKFRGDFKYYDLGYRLRRKYWGKGIATETAIVSLKYGFEELGLKEIYGSAHIDNIGSNKILKKVGLKFVEKFDYQGEVLNGYQIEKKDWKK